MENKIKKEYIAYFISGFIGYLLGSVAYTLLFEDTGQNIVAFKFISGVLFASLLFIITKLYINVKHRDSKKRKKEIIRDERNVLIRGKAAYLTLTLLLLALFIAIIVFVIKQNIVLSYFATGIYIVIFISYILSRIYWNKKI